MRGCGPCLAAAGETADDNGDPRRSRGALLGVDQREGISGDLRWQNVESADPLSANTSRAAAGA